MIDVKTHSLISVIPSLEARFTNRNSLAITPDGKLVYLIGVDPGGVNVIDTTTHSIIASISLGVTPAFIIFTPDGKFAYITNQENGSVSVIDVKSHSLIATVSVGNGPATIGITPEGKFAYVCNPPNTSISVIDITTHSVIATIQLPPSFFPSDIVFTPTGKSAYIIDGA